MLIYVKLLINLRSFLLYHGNLSPVKSLSSPLQLAQSSNPCGGFRPISRAISNKGVPGKAVYCAGGDNEASGFSSFSLKKTSIVSLISSNVSVGIPYIKLYTGLIPLALHLQNPLLPFHMGLVDA